MPAFDYWSIDEILAEQQEVTVKASADIVGGGILYPSSIGTTQKDLREGAKVTVPFWLAQSMTRRHAVELDLPQIFSRSSQEDLQVDPAASRLGDKCPYYFEVGMKVASLLRDLPLQTILMEGLQRRWIEMVNLLGKMGIAQNKTSSIDPILSIFPQTLTRTEQEIFGGGREAEIHFHRWVASFTSYEIKPSSVAEVAASQNKRARIGHA
mmetsp:Transcript_23043/g.41617  ORF Transcript_23043/g.41617 Transcript_23043/m.41617 type:complete len:210 (+) Transcript_23043:97-726(+)